MISSCYTAVLADDEAIRPYAVVRVTRGKPGRWQLPDRSDLWFKTYDDANKMAHTLNDSHRYDPKECAMLAIETIARGY